MSVRIEVESSPWLAGSHECTLLRFWIQNRIGYWMPARHQPPAHEVAMCRQVAVAWIAAMQFVRPLATQSHLDIACHVLEQRLEEEHGDVEVLAVPSE